MNSIVNKKNTLVWIQKNKRLLILAGIALVLSTIKYSINATVLFLFVMVASFIVSKNLHEIVLASKYAFKKESFLKGLQQYFSIHKLIYISLSTPLLLYLGFFYLEEIALRIFIFFTGILFVFLFFRK